MDCRRMKINQKFNYGIWGEKERREEGGRGRGEDVRVDGDKEGEDTMKK